MLTLDVWGRNLLTTALLTPLLGVPACAQALGGPEPTTRPRGDKFWGRAGVVGHAWVTPGQLGARGDKALSQPSGTSAAASVQVHVRELSAGALGGRVHMTSDLQADRSTPMPELRYAQNEKRDDRTDAPDIGDRTANRPAKGIQDNSFLLEEAYNQEPGVVQNIGVLRRQMRDWLFAFIQEFPIGSQAHQFSYTLPFADLRGGGQRASGIGDVLLNYRYQALYESDATPGIAPRFSLILPTGSERRGTGNGSFGFQSNVAVSKVVSDRVTLHANAGVTSLFAVQGRSPVSFNLGSSVIYAVTRDFNLLFETVGEQFDAVNADRQIDRSRALTLSPGLRYAFNFQNAQLVVGLAAPVTFTTRERPSYGAIVYLSFESKLLQ